MKRFALLLERAIAKPLEWVSRLDLNDWTNPQGLAVRPVPVRISNRWR